MMAKIEWVERRLRNWADFCMYGNSGEGFPSVNVLSRDWMPPAPGSTPTMRVSYAHEDAKRMHCYVAKLSDKLAHVAFVHYCMRLTVDQQMAELQCSKATLFARIDRLHSEIAAKHEEFCNKDSTS